MMDMMTRMKAHKIVTGSPTCHKSTPKRNVVLSCGDVGDALGVKYPQRVGFGVHNLTFQSGRRAAQVDLMAARLSAIL